MYIFNEVAKKSKGISQVKGDTRMEDLHSITLVSLMQLVAMKFKTLIERHIRHDFVDQFSIVHAFRNCMAKAKVHWETLTKKDI
jgi:hypothetical protein